MRYFYQIVIQLIAFVLPISRWFSDKMKQFVDGRKQSFSILENQINTSEKYIWLHVASLGEYEQGLPIMEAFRKDYPHYKIVLTFFSPSGYEIRKNNSIADITLYLPLDTVAHVRKFLDRVNPQMVFFIKYEFWPNYLYELRSEEHTSELQSRENLVCRLLREK